MYVDIHVKYPLFLSDFNELKFSEQIFEKCSNIEFHENTSSRSRVVPCGQTWRSFSLFTVLRKAPKNGKEKMYACPAMVTGVVSQLCRKNNCSQNTLLLKAATNTVSPATYSQQCHRILKYYVMCCQVVLQSCTPVTIYRLARRNTLEDFNTLVFFKHSWTTIK